MWNRKELKFNAKQVVKKNYWTSIVVCFLIALITGEFGTSIIGIWQTDDSMDPNYILNHSRIISSINGTIKEENRINSIFDKEKIERTMTDTEKKIIETVEANLNSVTKSHKYIFRTWDAIKLFNIEKTELGIGVCIAALIAVAFIIFVANPIVVGGKKYFLKAKKNNKTKIGVLLEVFKKESWINIAIIMFLKNLYNLMWYLTIIGGFIKTYEYRMIPYILAENPTIKLKEAFKLSKQMMKGSKWKTFVLDISFLGWDFLSVLTFGILGILYVNPYNAATIAELYLYLRKQAINEKYDYYEKLNDNTLN